MCDIKINVLSDNYNNPAHVFRGGRNISWPWCSCGGKWAQDTYIYTTAGDIFMSWIKKHWGQVFKLRYDLNSIPYFLNAFFNEYFSMWLDQEDRFHMCVYQSSHYRSLKISYVCLKIKFHNNTGRVIIVKNLKWYQYILIPKLHIVYSNYVQLFTCQSYLSKLMKTKEIKAITDVNMGKLVRRQVSKCLGSWPVQWKSKDKNSF